VTATAADTAAATGPVLPSAAALGTAAPRRRLPQWAAGWAPLAPLLATVLLLCVPEQTSNVSESGKAALADGASVVLVLWCAARLLRARREGQSPRGRLAPAAALLLGVPAVAFAIATVTSADPAASLPGFVRYAQVFVLVPAAVLLSLRDARDFRLVCGALVLLALVQGAVGLVQNLTGTGASYMGEDIRAVGTFGALDVMGMSTVVSYGLVAAFALGVAVPGPRPAVRAAALCCAGALVVPLVLSYSRGAWIATAMACLAVLLLAGVRRAALALAALLAAAVVLMGTTGALGAGAARPHDGVGERLASITDVSTAPDKSISDRYSLWAAAVDMWRSEPATGVGLKGFPAHRDAHASLALSSGSDAAGAGVAFQREPLLSPHNMYLLVLSEQGLIGTTALVGSWVALLVLGLRRLRRLRLDGLGAPARTKEVPGGSIRLGGSVDPGTDCGLVALGLLLWQAVDFVYSDIGGPSTVLTAVLFGLIAWWALPVPGREVGGEPAGGRAGGARTVNRLAAAR
jgi:O-antigen ligase